MCRHRGCRDIPLVKEFIAEHEAVTDLGGDAVRALDAGDRARAAEFAAGTAVLLRAHGAGEAPGPGPAPGPARAGPGWSGTGPSPAPAPPPLRSRGGAGAA
ncbi:hypothetical protein [Streptomyces termitum]|uniref:hypothetical protein n=1 Tax=Streptomyces termitum TaxID=67368 RepID=UPI0037A9DCDE